MKSQQRLDAAIRDVSEQLNAIPQDLFDVNDPDLTRAFDILHAIHWARGNRRGYFIHPENAVAGLILQFKKRKAGAR